MQSELRSKKVAQEHYDLGNSFYQDMLDENMQYSCGYWKGAKDLEEAQKNKLELVCKKLKLKKGEKVLDIGCGWGGFARYAAKNYGVHVVGYTISEEQAAFAREFTKGLSVEIVAADYRTIKGEFDKVVSIGMFEHVGYKNYREFMEIAYKCLKPHGLLLLHTIGTNKSVTTCEPWFNKYIFPNGMLPSVRQLGDSVEGLFVLEDWHSFGADYDKTLLSWYTNFVKNWSKHKDQYGERFFRMWEYYLLSVAGAFRVRRNQLWQMVWSKEGVIGGYESVR